MRIFLVLVFSLVTLCSQAQYRALSIKLGGATTSTYDISGFKNASIDYRSFILRAGNKFHLDFGYVVGFSFSQFNDPYPAVNIEDFKQTNMNLSAGLAVNLPITRKLRLNAAYSLGLLRESQSYTREVFIYDIYFGGGYFLQEPYSDGSLYRSTTLEYGIEYDLSKNLSLGLSLSKIKYNDALDEIAFRSIRFSYFF
jgi:hypothetical protein